MDINQTIYDRVCDAMDKATYYTGAVEPDSERVKRMLLPNYPNWVTAAENILSKVSDNQLVEWCVAWCEDADDGVYNMSGDPTSLVYCNNMWIPQCVGIYFDSTTSNSDR